MLIHVYGTPSPSTRKAIKWFDSHDLPYKYRDMREYPLSVNDIQHIFALTESGTEDVISTRSKIYKQLNLDLDSLSLQELYRYIQDYPNLMRNPIMFNRQKLQVGFDEHNIRQFIPREERRNLLMDLFSINQDPQIEGV